MFYVWEAAPHRMPSLLTLQVLHVMRVLSFQPKLLIENALSFLICGARYSHTELFPVHTWGGLRDFLPVSPYGIFCLIRSTEGLRSITGGGQRFA